MVARTYNSSTPKREEKKIDGRNRLQNVNFDYRSNREKGGGLENCSVIMYVIEKKNRNWKG